MECVDSQIASLKSKCDFLDLNCIVTKVAQGSFASIFDVQMKNNRDTHVILKLIALRPERGRGSRAKGQTVIEEAATEVKTLVRMSDIHGYVEFRSAQVLRGCPPPFLSERNTQWAEKYPEDDDKSRYHGDQLWLLIEMSDAGVDLQTILRKGFADGRFLHHQIAGERLDIYQSWDVFWTITEALARGEKVARFEHRDLHPGNICIKAPSPSNRLPANADDHETKRYTNLKITLIDYTVSRAILEDGEVISVALRDRTMFTQTSDNETDNRQYQMYERMRALVEDTRLDRRDIGEKWKDFVPMTNLLWLYHILKFLLDETHFYGLDARKGKETAAFPSWKERSVAKELKTVLASLNPDKVNEWAYLSASDLLEEKVKGIQTFHQSVMVEGESQHNEHPEDCETMRRHRIDRFGQKVDRMMRRLNYS